MKELKYPKRYGTVVKVDLENRLIHVRLDDNNIVYPIKLLHRRGKGHCGCRGMDFPVNTRVKVWTRNESFYFAKIGA